MRRDEMLARLRESVEWDLAVIGGGATGLGTAVDAASRGYRVALLEARDFAQGTSSRSTKLIHGGVRYLQQGNISLVLEALRERAILQRNAPHLVHELAFVVPNYEWWEAPFYGIGLQLYDLLAGRHNLGRSKHLTREETLARIPTVETEGLRGGVIYHDGQFDDARLAIHLAMTAADHGAVVLNYAEVVALRKDNATIRGVVFRDVETGEELELRAKAVVNATGPYADTIRRMDEERAAPMLAPSQGAHIVLDAAFLPGDCAIMVPHTDDGRVLFAIPWHGRVVVGTTDTPVDTVDFEPRPLSSEIEFLLAHAARYLEKDPGRSDILSAFAGLRPLVRTRAKRVGAALARDHAIRVSRGGLITVAGGKWTTYRKMAEDVVYRAVERAGLPPRPSRTETLPLHGWATYANAPLSVYGSDSPELKRMLGENSEWRRRVHPRLETTVGEVIWGARFEMARTVEDVLSRRTRALLLDARASVEAAPRVAQVLAGELERDEGWQRAQVEGFARLAQGYVVG